LLVRLAAIGAVVALWRLRGRHAVVFLVLCLLGVIVAVIVWNSLLSIRAGR
jgi:uncharacterized membrane protein